MATVLRPALQREAEEIFALAKRVAEARHDEFGIVRVNDHLTIVHDVPVLGKRECNVLTVSIGDRVVMHAAHDDSGPPLFLTFLPDYGWKWAIRRAAAALDDTDKRHAS